MTDDDDLRQRVAALNYHELRAARTWHQENALHYLAIGDQAAYRRQLSILAVITETLDSRSR